MSLSHQSVPLRFGPRPWARLRALTGADELAVSGVATEDAVCLLDALLATGPHRAMPSQSEMTSPLASGAAGELTAADRDQLLAVVYRMAFGDRIVSTATCGACRQRFDLSFSLGALAASRIPPARTFQGAQRLPTGHDECAVAALPAAEAERTLLERCGWPADDVEAASARMDELAPLLSVELGAVCPDCAASQPVSFDVQSYLLRALLGERTRLLDEVHHMARAYRWSWTDILRLGRRERRTLVRRLEDEDGRGGWRVA